MASVQANGITIEYDIHGEGTPLLMVMGLGGQLIDWPIEFVDMFVERGFKVIRFDNRDAGLSTEFDWETLSRAKMALAMFLRRKPAAGYTVSDMADDAAGLLEAIDIESAHVIGASMGGMIAQSLTIRHPHRVKSLTSIMSNTGDGRHGNIAPALLRKLMRLKMPDQHEAVEFFATSGSLIQGPHFDVELQRASAAVSVARSWRPEGTNRQTGAIAASPNRTDDLANVTAPTLVIHGLLDPLVKPSGGVATAKAVPGSRLLNFPDMAHDLPRVRWPEIVDAIVANADRSVTTAVEQRGDVRPTCESALVVLDNPSELVGLERSTTNESTVDVGLSEQLTCIRRLDGSSVLNPD